MTRGYAVPPTQVARADPVQAWIKPIVGPAGDRAERIAERIADRVMRSAGFSGDLDRGLARSGPSVAGHEAPDVVRDVVRSPGQPLDSRTRAFFEPKFGYDFSRVRVHAGDSARDSARALGARAYTVGSHVVLGEGSASASRLMAHELAHVLVESRFRAAPGAPPVVRRQTGSEPPISAAANFTAEETALLTQARATIQPKGNAIVGVLIPEGGKPIFLQSGGGQGFSSHIEGKASIVMREQGITRAKLIVELEPCQICDRSTYPGPNVPRGGVTGSASGKQISLQTSKINSALPAGAKLTVVGPESTGIYEGVGPKVSPKGPVVAQIGDPHPGPLPAGTTATPKTASPTPPVKAQTQTETPSGAKQTAIDRDPGGPDRSSQRPSVGAAPTTPRPPAKPRRAKPSASKPTASNPTGSKWTASRPTGTTASVDVSDTSRGGGPGGSRATALTGSASTGAAAAILGQTMNQLTRLAQQNPGDKDLAAAIDVLNKGMNAKSFVQNPKGFIAGTVKAELIHGVFNHFSMSLSTTRQAFEERFPDVRTLHRDPLDTGVSLEDYGKNYDKATAALRVPDARKALYYVAVLIGLDPSTPTDEIQRRIALANRELAKLPGLGKYVERYFDARDRYNFALAAVTNQLGILGDEWTKQPAGLADDLRRRGKALNSAAVVLYDAHRQLWESGLVVWAPVLAAAQDLETLAQGFEGLSWQFREFADVVSHRKGEYDRELNRLQAEGARVGAQAGRAF